MKLRLPSVHFVPGGPNQPAIPRKEGIRRASQAGRYRGEPYYWWAADGERFYRRTHPRNSELVAGHPWADVYKAHEAVIDCARWPSDRDALRDAVSRAIALVTWARSSAAIWYKRAQLDMLLESLELAEERVTREEPDALRRFLVERSEWHWNNAA